MINFPQLKNILRNQSFGKLALVQFSISVEKLMFSLDSINLG